MTTANVELCPHCGAKMKKYWHRLTPGLVGILVKCYDFVKANEKNIFKMKELKLSHSEYGNFQKLRFHALIAKKKVDGVWQEREWLITTRGIDFLCGRVSVPKSVETFRNKVTNHNIETVKVQQVWQGETPWFESKFDYSLFEPKQTTLL